MRVTMKLLLLPGLENLIRRPAKTEKSDELFFCTIVEPILLLEKARKGKSRRGQQLDWSTFQRGWANLLESNKLHVEPLDVACLSRSLFDRGNEEYDPMAIEFWPGIQRHVNGKQISTARTMRRLILRPSGETWWDENFYAEMEIWADFE